MLLMIIMVKRKSWRENERTTIEVSIPTRKKLKIIVATKDHYDYEETINWLIDKSGVLPS